jgi:5-methylcytosine-specific restriction protein A
MNPLTESRAEPNAADLATRLSAQAQFALTDGVVEVAGLEYAALRPQLASVSETAFAIALSRTPFEVRAAFIADRFAGRMIRRFSETVSRDPNTWNKLISEAAAERVEVSVRIDDQPCSTGEFPNGPWRSLEIEAARRMSRRHRGDRLLDWEVVAGEVLCFVLSGLGLDVEPDDDRSDGEVEGRPVAAVGTRFERNPVNRLLCIRHHGMSCWVCDFGFESVYGEIGLDFIEVHHLLPVSTRGETMINPVTELVPLCSNCHSMVHRQNPPIHPVALRERLGRAPKDNGLAIPSGSLTV